MKSTYFKVTEALIPAIKEDFIDQDGKFIEDKLFFLKNSKTDKFYSTYKVSNVNCHNCSNKQWQEMIEDYQIKEIDCLLNNNLIYKNTTTSSENIYYNLIIKQATIDDIIYSTKHLIINTTYYLYNETFNSITGPFSIKENDTLEVFTSYLNKETIYVFTKKQLFEKLINKKAA